MNPKPHTWTADRARKYHREYNRRVRQDPAIRARDNRINRESAARTREWKRYQYWSKFPYGYQAPPGLYGHELCIHFQEFISEISRDPGLAAYYWRDHFDPRCEDAEERWNAILNQLRKDRPGVDPLEKISQRANARIRNKERVPSPIPSY